ncbi:hypothetical protein PCC7418_2494 [Halothece sp. PCC 7418]|uniref:DUF2808 domain-containing protein n=1 Tax=Halothece sp. (strain PCC 7418) TaxID=65093 RepID=UPI0002A08851|nr:DUF2808 domain-containing protein [Halothece sp. PCC 7418]AFZ44641.1 hypothetical protein PCC7418_2494 [Halothece sp. PCC 7418]
MMNKLFSALILGGGLLVLSPTLEALAQSNRNSGITIFSGVKRENILDYRLDFDGQSGRWDRYRLRIPSKKLPFGASQFYITYPDYYEGKFDTDEMEVRIDGKPQPLSNIEWNQEEQLVSLSLEEPIAPDTKVEIVFSNVKNPRFGGTFYFNAQVDVPNDVAIRRYIGTWIIDID